MLERRVYHTHRGTCEAMLRTVSETRFCVLVGDMCYGMFSDPQSAQHYADGFDPEDPDYPVTVREERVEVQHLVM